MPSFLVVFVAMVYLSGVRALPLKSAHYLRGFMDRKKRGRPPLPEEERKRRQRERNKKLNEQRKASGWASQKKYRATHDAIRKYYEPKIRIPIQSKHQFDSLLASTGKTITELMLDALEKQYGVNLHADSTEQTHDIPTHQDDE